VEQVGRIQGVLDEVGFEGYSMNDPAPHTCRSNLLSRQSMRKIS
jgi:hypothetical protein